MNQKPLKCFMAMILGLFPSIALDATPSETVKGVEQSSSRNAKVYALSAKDVANVYIHPGGSVLTFPAKPSKIVLGREQEFDVQYIERDVAIVALSPSASANMFVYVLGRRYTINLLVSAVNGTRIIEIRDPLDDVVDVEVR